MSCIDPLTTDNDELQQIQSIGSMEDAKIYLKIATLPRGKVSMSESAILYLAHLK
jgi:hypothetical protein